MAIESISGVSLRGKLSSYYSDEFIPSPINIQNLLAGRTVYEEEVDFEELYLKTLKFDIIVHDENDNYEKAGVLIGRVFDIERCQEDGFPPLRVFENVDQYTYEIYHMGQNHHQGILSDNIFSIDSFIIYPEYRDKNVGTAVIHILSDVLAVQFNITVGCFILEPQPRYEDEREERPDEVQYEYYQEKCERFWSKLGFKRLDDSLYWYLNLDMKMLVNGQNPEKGENTNSKVTDSATIYEFKLRSDKKKE